VDGDQGGLSGRFAGRALLPGGFWLLLFFAAPFALVVAVSLGTPAELGGAIYGWYPENYSRVFDPLFVPVLARSVGYALATVVLCLLLRYPVAYYIARFGGRRKQVLIALVVLPFFVNYLIRTYAWVALLSDEGVINGVLGARSIHVTWPTTFQGVLAGSVLVFLPAVGDFVAAQLLGGPETYMVGNLIQQQFFGAEDWPFGGALTVVMMLFLLVFMVFYLRSAAREVRT
jgi:spermidine/putrescine transport system permease protein